MLKRDTSEYWALVSVLIAFFGFFSVRVWDIDFWWHLAAGKYILESVSIPSVDPFGVYDASSVWGQTVLKSQWLGQVMLYSIYRFFDIDGIILFRAAILTACLFTVYWRCRIAGTGAVFALPLVALSGLAILMHTGERPQLFSFLYCSLIFLLLDMYIISGRKWALYFVPLVMLLWSNTHGGAFLGEVALSLFGAGFIAENTLREKHFSWSGNGPMLVVVAMGATALLLTPNGTTTFRYLVELQNNPIRAQTSEYASNWVLWPVTMYYWAFFGVAFISLYGLFNRAFIKQGMVVFIIGAISMTGFRFIPFFVLISAPYVAASLNRMLANIQFPSRQMNALLFIVACVCLVIGVRQHRVFQFGIQEQRFPVGAANFIEANRLGGRTFTSMNWGGYLIWKLGDRVSVFVDGRLLDPGRIAPYTNILWTTPEGLQYFRQAGFDMVLVPPSNTFDAERYPLIAYLSEQPEWQAVYQDRESYLFVRKGLQAFPK